MISTRTLSHAGAVLRLLSLITLTTYSQPTSLSALAAFSVVSGRPIRLVGRTSSTRRTQQLDL